MNIQSSDRLVHYLSLIRMASPASATEICVQATEDPNLHVFGELLSTPTVKAFEKSPDMQKYFQLLRLFAHGTVCDFEQNRNLFPPLSDSQLQKLRMLTLVSLANGNNELRYDHLRRELAVETTRQIEDVVIDAVYAGLIRARMNQQAGTVEISAAEGRDVVTPEGIAPMVQTLNDCLARAKQLVREVDGKIEFIAIGTSKAKEQKARAAEQLDAVKSRVKATIEQGGKSSRARNKVSGISAEQEYGPFYRAEDNSRTMRTRRSRSSDGDA